MEQQNYQYQDPNVIVLEEGKVAKKFFASVFMWMFVALSLSTFAAYLFAANEQLLQFLVAEEGLTIFGWIVMFAPLGLVLTMSFGLSRLSYPALLGLFILYAVLTGTSLSFVLRAFEPTSILACFASAAAIFGIMAFLGYTTDVDLSKFGPILMVGVVGIFIASLINMFLGSPTFDYLISFAGVAVFTGLTAYDVQKIKQIGQGIETNGEETLQVEAKKAGIIAALRLYLDFLNIFLFLLRLFGSRK